VEFSQLYKTTKNIPEIPNSLINPFNHLEQGGSMSQRKKASKRASFFPSVFTNYKNIRKIRKAQ
jgi:hypothetical protein